MIFHVLNRGVGRRQIFAKEDDYAAFERVMAHALREVPIDLLAYCLMPNHWHLIVRPVQDGQLARFMQRLTMTHARRWQQGQAVRPKEVAGKGYDGAGVGIEPPASRASKEGQK
jgi:putative transposase